MGTDVELVKQSVNLVDHISQVVMLSEKGNRHWGLCPFHAERTPSFTVNPELGMYYCFGCKAHGDIFDFIMQTSGVGFGQALQTLADQYGITIEASRDAQPSAVSEARKVMAFAVETYHKCIQSPAGDKARGWLATRGIDDQQISHWQLGYAAYDTISSHPTWTMAAQAVGLTSNNRDRLSGRVVIPIYDSSGRPIALSGRPPLDIIPENTPKYLSTPNSPIWERSRTLYGLHIASPHIRSSKTVIVVEGQLDTISMHRAGYQNTIAPCGSGLSRHHVSVLSTMGSRAIVVGDGDQAGSKMAMDMWDKAIGSPLSVVAAILPPGYDPDTLARNDPGLLADLLDKATSPVQSILDQYRNEIAAAGDQPEQRAYIIRQGADFIGSLADPLVRARASQLWQAQWGISSSNPKGRPAKITTPQNDELEHLALALVLQRPDAMQQLAPWLLQDPSVVIALRSLQDPSGDSRAALDASEGVSAVLEAPEGKERPPTLLGDHQSEARRLLAWAACVELDDQVPDQVIWALASRQAREELADAIGSGDVSRAQDLARLLAQGSESADALLAVLGGGW